MAAPIEKDRADSDGDGVWVYARHIRHWRTGRIIYPKRGKFFRFRVRRKRR